MKAKIKTRYFIYRCYDKEGSLLYAGIQDRAYSKMDKYRRLLSCGASVETATVSYVSRSQRIVNKMLSKVIDSERPLYSAAETAMLENKRKRYIESQRAAALVIRNRQTETITSVRSMKPGDKDFTEYVFDPPLVVGKYISKEERRVAINARINEMQRS